MWLSIVAGIIVLIYIAFYVFYFKPILNTCEKKDSGAKGVSACSFLLSSTIDDETVKILLLRADHYSNIEKYKEAIEDYDTILDYNETNQISLTVVRITQIYERLAGACFNMGDFNAALKYANLALQEGSTAGEVYLTRGMVFIIRGDYSQGLVNLEMAESLKLDIPWLYYNLGAAYNFFEKYDKAYKSLKKVRSMGNSEEMLAKYNKQLAITYNGLGYYKESRIYYQKVIDAGFAKDDVLNAVKNLDKHSVTQSGY